MHKKRFGMPILVLAVFLAGSRLRADEVIDWNQTLFRSAVIDLSDREFKLLHYLALHAGEVVTRHRLLTEVWGYSFDPGTNLVDVCVRRLRKKLGPPAVIETIRHEGYRLAA